MRHSVSAHASVQLRGLGRALGLLLLAVVAWAAAADAKVGWDNASQRLTIAEAGGQAQAQLKVTGNATGPITVAWQTVDGTAVAGTQYVAASGTVVIPNGTKSANVSVGVVDNAIYTGDATFVLRITGVTGGVLNAPADAVVTIVENESAPAPVATPAISPAAGTYQADVLATATTTTAGAELRYRLDGADPSASDPPLPATGIAITQPATLAVRGFLVGALPSTVARAAYAFQVATVTADLAAGTYTGARSVTLSTTTAGAEIRYTLDGSTPTAGSDLASGAIVLPGSCTLKALALRAGWTSSAVFSAAYRLTVPTPVLSPASGTFYAPLTATATEADAQAVMRFTTDGKNPTAASPEWPADGVLVEQTTTVRVQAFRAGWADSAVRSATYTLRVGRPTASLPGGTYIGEQTVVLSCATPGATIHFTTDGSAPTAASPVASTPIAITQSSTLRAIATLAGWRNSSTFSATYTIRVAPVTASIPGGLYLGHRSVTLTTTTAGADIHYTTNGSTPTLASPIATGPIELPGTVVLRAVATRTGWRDSAVYGATYTLQVEPVTTSLAAGTYVGEQSIVLTSPTTGAEIHYTINGSTPTAASPVASGPIALVGNSTLRAIAMITGWRNSATLSAVYALRVPAPALNPLAGTYTAWPLVTASSADPLATLRYTTGTTVPGSGSAVFPAAGLQLNSATTVNLIATRTGWTSSVVVSAAYARNLPPVAAAVAVATDEDVALTITPSASDPDTSALVWTVVAAPAHGVLSGFDAQTGAVRYTPAAEWHGVDQYRLAVSDLTTVVEVPVDVTVRSVNDAPVAVDLAIAGDEDVAIPGQIQASDVDGDALSWVVLAGPASGQVVGLSGGTFSYVPNRDFHGTDSFTLGVSDATVSVPVRVDVTVQSVNDAPVAADLALSGDEDTSVAIHPAATDADGDALLWAVLSGPQHGSLSAIQADGSCIYTPAADWSGSDAVVLTVSDASATVEVQVAISVAAVNDPPQLAAIESGLTWFRDGDAGLAVTAALTVSDVDSANLSGASVQITSNLQPGDELQFTSQNGITGVWNAGNGTLTLSGSATLARYQTALRTVKYRSTQAFPGTAVRTISFGVSDGSSSNVVARTIAMVTRSSPVWSEGFEGLPVGGDLHQLEQQGLTRWHAWNAVPAASTPVSAAQAHSGGASVAIAGAADLVHEYKGVNAGGWRYTAWQYIPTGFTGTSYFILLNTYRDTNGTDGKNWSTQVRFTGNQVLPDYAGGSAALIKGAWVELRVDIDLAANLHRFFYNGTQVFERSWTGGTTGGGVLNLAAVDLYGNGASAVYYDDVSLTPIVPTISGGGSVAYVENAAPVAVMPALAVDGFGVAQLTGAQVQLTGDLAQDSLSATVAGGISQSWNPATGTLTLSGAATPAAYQAVLRTVAFANASDAPTVAPRTIAFAVTAPSGTSNTVSATVTVTAVNDAPVVVALSLSGDEDTTLVGQASASDLDGDALTWSLQSDGQFGRATVTASGAISYVPTANWNGADSITLAVSDNQVTTTLVVPIVVREIDDSAVIAGPDSGAVAPESDLRLTGFTLSDIDSPIISLNLAVGAGAITLPGLAASGAEITSGTGLWDSALSIQGSAVAVNAAVAEIIWRSPVSTGATTLALGGNGGALIVPLQTQPQAAPIAIRSMAASTWTEQPHGTRILPGPARFWNIDVAADGAYYLWANGMATEPIQVELDGVLSGSLAMPAGWNCTNTAGVVQTLQLSAGIHRLALMGQPTSLDGMILVSAVAEAVADRQPLLAGPGAVTVIDPKAYDVVEMSTGHSWLPGPNGGLQALPDVEHYDQVGTPANRGLSYAVYFAQPGSYVVWVRAQGTPTGDSLIVALDGAKPATYVTNFPNGVPGWKNKYMNGAVVTLVVATSGIHMVDVRWREDGVELTQIAISGVGAWYPLETVAVDPSARPGIVTTDGQGRAVFEAEIAQRQPSQTGQVWQETAMAGAVGSVMAAGTDQGYTYSADIRTAGAVYYVRFPTAGTYDLWVRGFAPDWSGDSYFLGLAGAQAQTMTLNKVGAFAWARAPMGTSTGTITVASPGVWPVNLWMREDGFRLDRVIIQPAGAPVPTDIPAIPASTVQPVFSSNG